MQSPKRLNLLIALKEVLHRRPVPAPFWGCLQVCALEKLSELVEIAQVIPEPLFKLLERNGLSIVLNWLGLLPYDNLTDQRPQGRPGRHHFLGGEAYQSEGYVNLSLHKGL